MRLTALFPALVLVLLMPMLSRAAPESGGDKTLAPYFLIENGDEGTDSFPLKHTDVQVEISGVIASVTVVQHYGNEGTRPLNARYVFPASTRAAVNGMTMTVGEQQVKAKVKKREIAKQEFESAKKEGKNASLLEQQRPNVFTMQVANIMPGDQVAVELRYTELLVPTDSVYEFVFTTVVGPRYSNQPQDCTDERETWVQNPYLQENIPSPSTFNIDVRLAAPMPIQEALSPSHKIAIAWDNERSAAISLDPVEKDGGNRDFVLRYRLAGRKITSGLMLHRGDKENFFLLMVEPPQRVAPETIPPREYLFVVDVSGSMYGFPLDTAKELMRKLVGGLRPVDRFNVLLFAADSRLLAPASLPADQENINRAIRLLEGQRGGGGTELYKALKRGLALPITEEMSRTMLVITDGYIAAEKDVLRLISDNLDHSNVFAFGIGSTVNRHLIEGIAKAGMGEEFIALNPQETGEAAARFQRYVESPALTGIKVKFDGFDAYDVEPQTVPDLFASRPVCVFGKWRNEAKGRVRLTGFGGGAYEKTIEVSESDTAQDNPALPYLWARQRIARLSDFNFGPVDDDNRGAIANLGLTYNLLTSETSFIAVAETVRNTGGAAEEVNQPLPLPQRVSKFAVGGKQVPEPGLSLLLGLAALVVGRRFRRGR